MFTSLTKEFRNPHLDSLIREVQTGYFKTSFNHFRQTQLLLVRILSYLSNVIRYRFLLHVVIIRNIQRICGLVVSIADYKHRGLGFDSRALLGIFLREFGSGTGSTQPRDRIN
jgi:hypothetical protein